MATEIGEVMFFNEERKYGFISAVSGEHIFFDGNVVEGSPVESGDEVEYRRMEDYPRRSRAEFVKRICAVEARI